MKLGDSGAVLVEFAIILPVMLLLTLGMFDIGIMLLQSMQLNFVTQGAAFAEANAIAEAAAQPPGSGFSPWVGDQLGAIATATPSRFLPRFRRWMRRVDDAGKGDNFAASAAIDSSLLACPAARLANGLSTTGPPGTTAGMANTNIGKIGLLARLTADWERSEIAPAGKIDGLKKDAMA